MDTTESHPSKIPEAPNHVFVYKRSHLRILQRLLNSLSRLTETAGTSVGEILTFFKLLFYMKKTSLGLFKQIGWIRAATRNGQTRQLPPPKYLQTWWRSRAAYEKLFSRYCFTSTWTSQYNFI